MGDFHRVGGPPRRRLNWPAAKTSVLLSALFIIVYGGTNWLTAQRPSADVRAWFFAGELTAIPYVPLLVIPYMSIDLFFFLAPFLCHNDQERCVFARRMVFSILTAAVCFLALPLRLAWPARPQLDGWFGTFVEQSVTAPFLMEYPHNLFPALHVALAMILAEIYGRHTRGLVRIVSHAWFTVIALSTVLTWQHHVVDLAGGAMLAGFAFYLFRSSETRQATIPNRRIGFYYAAGVMLITAIVPVIWPWGVFLLWPAAALGVVAAGYLGLGPAIFRKSDGRLPWSTRFVLAPILLAHYLSFLYYRRQCRAWNAVAPGVLMGRALSDAEARTIIHEGVTAVLDLTAESSEAASLRRLKYLSLPILDLTPPTCRQLHEAASFLASESPRGAVYVHCKAGYSRSAAVVAAYLLIGGEVATVEEAVHRLRQARPSIILRPEVMNALRLFEKEQRTSGGAGMEHGKLEGITTAA